MKSSITREEFSKEVSRLSEEFAEQVWQAVVEAEADVERCDEWMRVKGSEYLREVLGKALSQRSERLGVSGACECGASMEFRQHRAFRVHTVLAGRDVELSVVYAQCCECRQGKYPPEEMLPEMPASAHAWLLMAWGTAPSARTEARGRTTGSTSWVSSFPSWSLWEDEACADLFRARARALVLEPANPAVNSWPFSALTVAGP